MMDFQRQTVNSHFLTSEVTWEDSRSPLCIVEEPHEEEDDEFEKPIDLTTKFRPCQSERTSPALTPKKRGSLSWMKENNFGRSSSEASIPSALLQNKRNRLEHITGSLQRNSPPNRCDSVPALRERLPNPQSEYEQQASRCMSDSRLGEQPFPRAEQDQPTGGRHAEEFELRRATSESVLQIRLTEIELFRRQLLRQQFLQGLTGEAQTSFSASWLPYGLLSYQQLLQSTHNKDIRGIGEHYPSHSRSSPESLAGDDRSGSPSDFHRRRTPRALTGKHVRLGTGASPSTLITLRRKIQERQRLQPFQSKAATFGKMKRK